MSTVMQRSLVVGFSMTVLVGVIGFPFVADQPTIPGGGTGHAPLVGSAGSFTIEGGPARPLSVGVMAPIDLKLSNPQDVPLSVRDLAVIVRKVQAPKADVAHPCAIGDFTVTQVSSAVEITVGARSSRTLSSLNVPQAKWPRVGIRKRAVNQDGCKGSSLTLGYTATGNQGK